MGAFLLLFLVLFPILASFAVYPLRRLGKKYRDGLILAVPALELLGALLLIFLPASAALPGVCGLGLRFTAGSLRSLLAVITAFMWMMTALGSPEYFAKNEETSNRYYLFYLITLGAIMGVFLASDLYTLFIFFEIMSFASYVWVVHNETPEAIRAGSTYLAVAVVGGMVLLVGLFLLWHLFGTLEIDALASLAAALPAEERPMLTAAGFLCLFGFGAKAGVFPLHIWLPKAHPVAPAPASALLSGILTKSGIFGILVISRNLFLADADWNTILLVLSLVTMFLGALLALFSVDLKRTLACSSVSQIGFILLGIAMQGFLTGENALATWGTVLHMLNHSLIKLVLFMGAGVVYLGTHALDLNTIRGWGRDKPWLKAAFFIGAASICGIPLSSGYVSKTLLHESIVEYIHHLSHGTSAGMFHAAEWIFLFTGGLTVAYMTKIFVAVFVEPKAPGQHKAPARYMSRGTQAALGCGALVLTVLGLTPSLTMQEIAARAGEFLHGSELEEAFHYFSPANLKGAAISIAIGAAVYLLVVRKFLRSGQGEEIRYPNRWPAKLDLEELVYRPLLRALSFFGAVCARLAASAGDFIVFLGGKLLFLRAPGIFVPKRNENFGAYGKKPESFLVKETFSFNLMLSGLGLIVMLLYVLLR